MVNPILLLLYYHTAINIIDLTVARQYNGNIMLTDKIGNLYGGLRRENYILFFGCIVTRFGSMVHAVMTMILNQKMEMTATQVSLYMVLLGLANMLFSMLGGKLADRFNKKSCIIVCDSISVLLYFICSIIKLSLFSVVLLSLAAVMQTTERPMYDALLTDITAPADRQKAFALNYLGVNIGALFAPTLAGILFKNHLSLLFLLSGVAIGASTVFIALFVRNISPEKTSSALEARRDADSIFRVLWDNKILLSYMLLFAVYCAVYAQYDYIIPLDFGRMYGEDGALLFGTVNSTNCLVVIIFSPIFLYTLSRVKSKWKMNLSQVFLCIGYVVYLSFMKWIPAYYISMVLFTFGEILSSLGVRAFLASQTPASHRGRVNGAIAVLDNIANSIMMLVSGYLYENKGHMASWTMVLAVISAVIIITMILNIKNKDI